MAYVTKVDRRTTLKWLAAVVATLPVAGRVRADTYVKTPGGYGTDPDLMNPDAPWERIMSDYQLQQTAVICDLILPAEAPHPSASEVGVPDFVNEWVSSPYEQTQKRKKSILGGLEWIDREARKRFGKKFIDLNIGEMHAIMDDIADPVSKVTSRDAHQFFNDMRYLTLGGYYTTDAGFEDIGYIGNVAMETYPGPNDELIAMLEERMQKQGI